MINQMWSNALYAKCDEWEKRFEAWAMDNGLTDPVQWLKDNWELPNRTEEYNKMIKENMRLARGLRQQYQSTVEAYPVKSYNSKV